MLVGDQLLGALSWEIAGECHMGKSSIRVSMLGVQEGTFYCSPDLFIRAAVSVGGDAVLEPPPFACPCIDGVIIIYTLKRTLVSGIDVHGGYILMTKEELENEYEGTSLCSLWREAPKAMNAGAMLKKMGFGVHVEQMLN